MTTAEMLKEFHTAFGLHMNEGPANYKEGFGLHRLRWRLLDEEFREYTEALERGDIVELADALADMVYVIYGTALTYGIDLDAVLAEVHRSNMTKIRGGTRSDGKVMKGPDYQAPNLVPLLRGAE